ncbi:HAD-IA family hydrolase [Streptomyces sp. NPDC059564]|uniref:HAD-IA family hydrolase n=1 Tax=Streptomyces sp. NPDC059564 TaxID=3346865 RepID=UPI0036B475DC
MDRTRAHWITLSDRVRTVARVATLAREHVSRLKPAPEAYVLAAANLAVVPGRCVAFENTAEGLEAALAAGIPVIDVRDGTWAGEAQAGSAVWWWHRRGVEQLGSSLGS